MTDYTYLPELDRPPTYASADPLHLTVDVNHQPNPEARFETLSPTASHTYEIWNTHTGLNVTYGEHQIYYIGRYKQRDTPDLIIYGGYDQHGPQLALAEYIPYDKDFNIYLGGLKHPGKADWDTVRSASDGRMFHSPYYRFEAYSTPTDTEQRVKQRLHWKKTHESKLGASRFSTRDFKLIDESSDDIIAVYTEHNLGSPGHLKGKIEYRRKMDENVEIAALAVLMALLEKMRRNLRQGGRAVASGWVIR